jgi:hypothetical protein
VLQAGALARLSSCFSFFALDLGRASFVQRIFHTSIVINASVNGEHHIELLRVQIRLKAAEKLRSESCRTSVRPDMEGPATL